MQPIDYYRACRDYIVAQDHVISTRVGWCVAINSVAITAVAAALVSERAAQVPTFVLLAAIALLVLMNLMFYGNVRYNANTSSTVATKYAETKRKLKAAQPPDLTLDHLPNVEYGGRDDVPKGWRAEFSRLRNVLLLFAFFWVVMAGYAAWHAKLWPFA